MNKTLLLTAVVAIMPVIAFGQQPAPQQPTSETAKPKTELPKSDIVRVQKALQKEGYNPGNEEGNWTPESQAALTRFQAARAVPVTNGEIDANTMGALHLNKRAATTQ